MTIHFFSKYKNLIQDLSYYWDIHEIHEINTDFQILIIDTDKTNAQLFANKKQHQIIIGVTTDISLNMTEFDDLIRIPYDLPYIMFKLNKLNQIASNNQEIATMNA